MQRLERRPEDSLNARIFDYIHNHSQSGTIPGIDEGNLAVMKSTPSQVLVFIAFAAVVAAAPASATTIDVNFDGETPFTNVSNDYSTSETSLISFSDTVGANLQLVTDPLRTNGSTALAVFNDYDDSGLLIELDFLASAIQMDIGNDSGDFSSAGDAAVLTVFLDGVEVGSESLALNRNLLMDQTILFDGALAGIVFDSAILKFDVDSSLGLTEIVDNVSATVSPVPEPTAATVFGVGSMVFGLACRRRASIARGHRS